MHLYIALTSLLFGVFALPWLWQLWLCWSDKSPHAYWTPVCAVLLGLLSFGTLFTFAFSLLEALSH